MNLAVPYIIWRLRLLCEESWGYRDIFLPNENDNQFK